MDADCTAGAKLARRHTLAPDHLAARSAVSGAPNTSLVNDHIVPADSPADSATVSQSSQAPSADESTPRSSSDDATLTARQQKRLSLNFPIQPAAAGSRSRPQSWYGTPVPSPDIPQTPTSGNFLTALATQERRVLELKEELQKAEADLQILKRQWASHEASRKRSDIRSGHPLQPLNTSLANIASLDADDADGASARMQKEMERRRALLSGTKTSQRKVFSGSRHTRQLSLLSPDKTYVPSFPQPANLTRSADLPSLPAFPKPPAADPVDVGTEASSPDKDDFSGLQKDALLRAGKQFATDFKDGLLTFIEDLRQATVGEEATNGPQADGQRPGASAQGVKGNPRAGNKARSTRPQSLSFMWDTPRSADTGTLIDIGGSFWKEHGLEESQPSSTPAAKATKATKATKPTTKTPRKQLRQAVDDFGESWDTWDTPTNDKSDARSNGTDSASDSVISPVSGRSSTRTSTSSTSTAPVSECNDATPFHNRNNDSIPWPALDKLSPTNLKRTASHLMKEWERSMAASPPEGVDADPDDAAKDGKHD